jgi:hypothetical protein
LGCVEHTSIPTQFIKEANKGGKGLTVVWLDLANTYGSVPQKLIKVAMDTYIPDHVKKTVNDYFEGIQICFTVGEFAVWQNLEKGIVTGSTISPILFM